MLKRNQKIVYLIRRESTSHNVELFSNPEPMRMALVTMSDEEIVAIGGRLDKKYYKTVIRNQYAKSITKNDRFFIDVPVDYDPQGKKADYKVSSIRNQHETTTIMLESRL